MRTPVIELLWWEGCPSTERALGELRRVLDDLGADCEIQMREIATEEAALDAQFVGSPTILIDGVDAVAAENDEPVGLGCRVYRRRDGRIAPTPDPDDLRDELLRALGRAEISR